MPWYSRHGLVEDSHPVFGADPSATRIAELVDVMDWYRRCLEDVQDRRVVRGLDEAKAGYDSARDELLRYAEQLGSSS